jgi:hypothetical protein
MPSRINLKKVSMVATIFLVTLRKLMQLGRFLKAFINVNKLKMSALEFLETPNLLFTNQGFV